MAKKVMGRHWCNRCEKEVSTHDGGGYLYNVWLPCQTCDECGYSVALSHKPTVPSEEQQSDDKKFGIEDLLPRDITESQRLTFLETLTDSREGD